MFWALWFVVAWLDATEPVTVDPPDPALQQRLFTEAHNYCPHAVLYPCETPAVNADAPITPRRAGR